MMPATGARSPPPPLEYTLLLSGKKLQGRNGSRAAAEKRSVLPTSPRLRPECLPAAKQGFLVLPVLLPVRYRGNALYCNVKGMLAPRRMLVGASCQADGVPRNKRYASIVIILLYAKSKPSYYGSEK